LPERRRSAGSKLSGGEQRMLATGRILRTGADLSLLDEPAERLAPVIVPCLGDPQGQAVHRPARPTGFPLCRDAIRDVDLAARAARLHDYPGL
jgi:branched-chain amino acid transport system ATP-binding protein